MATILSLPEIVHVNLGLRLGYYNTASTQIFQTLKPVDIITCIDQCKRYRACEYINYTRKLRLCVLIATLKPCSRESQVQIGVVYANRSEWDLTPIPTECEYCSTYEECVTETPTSQTCVKRGCGKPDRPDDTTQLGNMYGINNRVKINCVTSDLTAVMECQQNETWTNDNFTCLIPTEPPTPSCIPEAGLRDQNYFISGNYDSSTDKWFTDSGTQIPKSMAFWTDEEAYDGSVPCLKIDENAPTVDDADCTLQMRFICEEVI
ncbi:hypothetical protein ACF0H5_023185 [Mactra antiquata]